MKSFLDLLSFSSGYDRPRSRLLCGADGCCLWLMRWTFLNCRRTLIDYFRTTANMTWRRCIWLTSSLYKINRIIPCITEQNITGYWENGARASMLQVRHLRSIRSTRYLKRKSRVSCCRFRHLCGCVFQSIMKFCKCWQSDESQELFIANYIRRNTV